MFSLYKILVYSGFGLDRFHCIMYNVGHGLLVIITQLSTDSRRQIFICYLFNIYCLRGKIKTSGNSLILNVYVLTWIQSWTLKRVNTFDLHISEYWFSRIWPPTVNSRFTAEKMTEEENPNCRHYIFFSHQ